MSSQDTYGQRYGSYGPEVSGGPGEPGPEYDPDYAPEPGPDGSGPGEDGPEEGGGHRGPRRRLSRGRKVLLGALALLAVGVLLTAGTLWWAYEHYTGRVDRIPNAFPSDVPEKHRPQPSAGGETYLLVGVDARSDLPLTGSDAGGDVQWQPGAQRSDTMMLVHLPESRDGGYVVSLPRDSWVNVPGRGKAKLNAAFSWGGPPLLIDTVQRLTKVKVDHLAVIDWSGFRKLTDHVGGVDLDGQHMSGEQALAYVRERKSLPRGDLDRTQRQQEFLREVVTKTMQPGNFSNPLEVKDLLDAVTDTVSVDESLSDGDMRGLMWDMKGVRSGDLVFMNAPVSGTDMIDGQSVVLLDDNAGDPLWESMRNDTMDAYVQKYPTDRLGAAAP